MRRGVQHAARQRASPPVALRRAAAGLRQLQAASGGGGGLRPALQPGRAPVRCRLRSAGAGQHPQSAGLRRCFASSTGAGSGDDSNGDDDDKDKGDDAEAEAEAEDNEVLPHEDGEAVEGTDDDETTWRNKIVAETSSGEDRLENDIDRAIADLENTDDDDVTSAHTQSAVACHS